MTILHSPPSESFAASLLNLRSQQVEKGDSLAQLRSMAWDIYQKKSLPSPREEVFNYVTLRKLYSKQYQAASSVMAVSKEMIEKWILCECSQSVLVFVNGQYSKELSNTAGLPSSVVVEPLAQAMRTYGSFIQNQWQRQLKEERDGFAVMNTALHPAGVFIYVPPKIHLSTPLQILHVIDTDEQSTLLWPRWHLFAGNHSSLEIIAQQAVLSGQAYANISYFDCALEENAHVKIAQLVTDHQENAWYLESARATLKRDSTLDAVAVTEGGEAIRLDWHVKLAGENAEANLNGIAMLQKTQENHMHVLMEHQAPHCRSMQFFKNVLKDASRSSFEGKIYVHSTAEKTDAFQLNNNLTLSDTAQAYSKPNLEIFTGEEVKASHGATFGQLNEEELFYLRARGLSSALAHHLLIQGFCREITDKLFMPSLIETVGNIVSEYVASLDN